MDEKTAQEINSGKLRHQAEERLDENRGTTPLVGTEEAQRTLHELQVHQIELEMQNAELIATREKLEAALERYNNLFDFAPVGYVTLDHDGTIQAVNFAGASLLGRERSRLLGRCFGLFVTEEYRSTFAGLLDAVFAGHEKKVCEVTLLNDGNVPNIVQIEALSAVGGLECRIILIDISERKRSERALVESERIYRAIGETIDYGIWISAPDGRNTYASDSFLNLVGITQEQCSNFGWGEVLHPDDSERTIDAWKECVSIECKWDIEQRFRGVDGQWHHILARGVPVRDDQGTVTCWAGINLDISRFKEVEKNLRESEERHRLLSETMLHGVVHQDANGMIISMNPAAERILGRCREEFLGNSSLKVEHDTIRENGETFPGMEHPAMVALRTGQTVQGVVMGVFNPKLGEYRWVNINAVPIFRQNDTSPSEVYAVFEDITERKQAEEALRENEARLRLAQESASVGIWDWEVDTGSLDFTPELNKLYGLPPGTIKTYQDWRNRVHPDDIGTVETRRDEAIAKHKPFDLEFRVLHSSGEYRWLVAKGGAVYDEAGTTARVLGVNIDITERKRVEELLRESEERFRTLANAIPQLCWMANADGWIFWYNQRWYEYTCTTPEQMEGWGWQSVHNPEVLPQVLEGWKASIASGEPFDMVFPLRGCDGKFRSFLTRAMPVCDQEGNVVSWCGTNTDIDEQKQVEEALENFSIELENRVKERTTELRVKDEMLLMQSRQAAMGEMIGNIAHQWRQPLNTLGLTIQSLVMYYDLGEFTRELLNENVDRSMELIQHMSRTIDDFRNYFRPDKEKTQFKLSETINTTISLIKDSFSNEHITIAVTIENDPAVNGYQNEFAQVILNILNNARDALVENEVKNPKVAITIGTENGMAVVTIFDNAGGIPEEIIEKIFDPYFTTKGPQAGTGVGLFMSKSIIEKSMNGRLTVRNTADGAQFRIEV
jgi:PAS domain S-box-containing protein